MFKYYRPYYRDTAPTKTVCRPPIDENDAQIANAAILHIRLKEFPRDETQRGFFSIHKFILDKWATEERDGYFVRNSSALAGWHKVTTRTIRNRAQRAREEFLAEYLLIVRDIQKLSKKKVA